MKMKTQKANSHKVACSLLSRPPHTKTWYSSPCESLGHRPIWCHGWILGTDVLDKVGLI